MRFWVLFRVLLLQRDDVGASVPELVRLPADEDGELHLQRLLPVRGFLQAGHGPDWNVFILRLTVHELLYLLEPITNPVLLRGRIIQ